MKNANIYEKVMMKIIKTIEFWSALAKNELAATSMRVAPSNRNQAQFVS